MDSTFYTLAVWQVKPGMEAAFIGAWLELGATFSKLQKPPQAGSGKLLQSLSDPSLFYSFGPWNSIEDIRAMREDATAQAGIARLSDLCVEARPGSFRLAATA